MGLLIAVYAKKTSKNSVSDFGGPEKLLKEINYLFGTLHVLPGP